jgi:hypothetical protein
MHVDVEPDARAGASLSLTVPDAPDVGFTVVGAGFAPDSWIWITVEDLTAGTQPINGPEAFQPDPDGTFTRTDQTALTCGHTVQANAFVDNAIVATSDAVTPRREPVPLDVSTADANATPATSVVYAGLVAAPTRVDHRLVIGQALRGWDSVRPVSQPVTALTELGLPAPKLLEVDVTDFDDLHEAGIRALLLSHAAQGGLIGLSYHVGSPFTGKGRTTRSTSICHSLPIRTIRRRPQARSGRPISIVPRMSSSSSPTWMPWCCFARCMRATAAGSGGDSATPGSSKPSGRGCSAT